MVAKYSLETKLKAVTDVLELGMSVREVSRFLNIAKSSIQRWVDRYELYGTDGLLMSGGKYSGDFKVRVVEYMQKNNVSVCSTAALFGIPSDSTLSNWQNIYCDEGIEALRSNKRVKRKEKKLNGRKCEVAKDNIKKPKKDKPVEEDLITEVKRLRMENEYLKKLNALVQAKEKSAKKIK